MAKSKTSIYPLPRLFAIGAGTGLTALSGWYAWSSYHSLVAPICAGVGAMMFHFSEASWKDRHRIRALLLLGLGLLAAMITLMSSLDRVASERDRGVQVKASENLGRDEAARSLTRAEEELTKAEAEATKECTSGRGPKCLGLEQRADAARERVRAASSEKARLGAPIEVDSQAIRLAAILPISTSKIALYQPLMLPFWLDAAAMVLLTLGLSSPSRATVEPPRKKRRRKIKRTQPPKRPSSPRAVANDNSNVVAFAYRH